MGVPLDICWQAVAVRVLRNHRYCGDQYPASGWRDVMYALGLYTLAKRRKKLTKLTKLTKGGTNEAV